MTIITTTTQHLYFILRFVFVRLKERAHRALTLLFSRVVVVFTVCHLFIQISSIRGLDVARKWIHHLVVIVACAVSAVLPTARVSFTVYNSKIEVIMSE